MQIGSFLLKVESLPAQETKAIPLFSVACILRKRVSGYIFQATIMTKAYETTTEHANLSNKQTNKKDECNTVICIQANMSQIRRDQSIQHE